MTKGIIRQGEGMGDRPLDGVRVLDLAIGPMAAVGRHYAELGADVVRIEPACGAADRSQGRLVAGTSLDFIAANLGKRAATHDQLTALAAGADILIAPRGALEIAGLRSSNPALVVLSYSDFGDTGAFANWVGSGPVFHALSGELSRSGIPGREPLLPPGDLALDCAVVQAVHASLVCYWNALRTGHGDHIDFSILDGAAQALDPGYGPAGSANAGGRASDLPRGRPEARFQYPILPCEDGFVRLCVLAPRQWHAMLEWMGRPEEFADPAFNNLHYRFASRTLLPAIARLFAHKTRKQVEEEGQRFGVPVAAVLGLDEVLATEQIKARRAFTQIAVAPDIDAPFPDGVIEVDGIRMGIAGDAPAMPGADVQWRSREATTRGAAPDDLPFAGLRVLDFGVIVVGAESGRLLADLGADVIKVESSAFPDGSRQNRMEGPISQNFATGHRNQRSLGLNLRDPKGKELLLELIRDTDVLLSNFKGGTLQSLGLDYAALKAINPRVVVTDSSAFGPTGPWSQRMGYGPLVRASAGLTLEWRYPGEAESFSDAVTVYPDHVAGRIGVIGVTALLIRRSRTGRGGQVSVSQAEVMLSHMATRIAADAIGRNGHCVTPEKSQSAVYHCAGEDEWCVVTLRDQRDEQAAMRLTEGMALSDWLATRDTRAGMEALQAAGVPAGAMLRVSELPDFDYFIGRGFFREARHPHIPEPFTVHRGEICSERLPAPPDRPAPLTGEHTREIALERLGLKQEEVEALIDTHVLE